MFRRLEKEDYNIVAELLMKAFKNPPWNEDWNHCMAYQRVEQLNDGKYTRCYVYCMAGRIVGVICGKLVTYVSGLEYVIEDFYIDPEYQRMRIGHEMMELLENELQEVKGYNLLTGKGFYAADFYKKKGFSINESIIFMHKKSRN